MIVLKRLLVVAAHVLCFVIGVVIFIPSTIVLTFCMLFNYLYCGKSKEKQLHEILFWPFDVGEYIENKLIK